MKKSILGLVAIGALVTGPAMAADMRMPVKAPLAPPPVVTSWTGCYIDGGIGYGMWNQDTNSIVTATGAPIGVQVTNGGRGWLGRLGGGCDYQFGSSWVIGAFGDFDFMDLNGKFGDPSGPVTGNEKESSAWYAGGRLGYLISPTFLGYIDGGWTQTRFDGFGLNSAFVPAVPTGLSIPAPPTAAGSSAAATNTPCPESSRSTACTGARNIGSRSIRAPTFRWSSRRQA